MFVAFFENGKIESTSVEQIAPSHDLMTGGLISVIEVAEAVSDPNAFYVDGLHLVRIPPRPSPHHVFDYTTKQWIDPRTPETEWPLVRAERDRRLLASDWTQLPDVPIQTKEVWATYRQALRDITEQPDPFNIVWPVAPG